MRNIALFLSLTISALTMSAATPAESPFVMGKRTATVTAHTEAGKTINVNKPVRHKISPRMAERTADALRAADKLYNVTVTLEGNDTRPEFFIYNENLYINGENDEENPMTCVFQVPAGTYDAAVNFWSKEHSTWGYLFKEQFEVNSDMSVTLSEQEITETIVFYPTLKDGRKATLPVMVDWETGEMDSSNATADYIGLDYILYRDGCEPFCTGVLQDRYQTDAEGGLKFCTNKTSDKYNIAALAFVKNNDGNIEVTFSDIKGFTTKTAQSYNKDFVEYKAPDFFHTPLYDKEGIEGLTTLVGAVYWKDDYQLGGGGLYMEKVPKIEVAQQPMPDIKVAVMTGNVDVDKFVEYEMDGKIYKERLTSVVKSLPAVYNDGKWNYVNRGHSECGNFSYQIPEQGEVVEYPGHPRFSFSADEINGKMANSAPLLITMQQINKYGDYTFRMADPQAYIGRYGEVRLPDRLNLSTVVNLDGKKVFDSADGTSYNEWLFNHDFEGPAGVMDITFENRNVMVDKVVEGSNIAHLHYDENSADGIAPTPQMLMFRNTRDEITDRFEKAEDGVIELACADFVWHNEGEPAEGYNKFYFTAQPCDVKVEAAAYQTDNFKEIAVEEVPELFFMPGFGYFYRGSLAGVEANSANSWYDLRLTVADAAGNYLTQTLSPAFAIGEYAAITTVSAADTATPAEYFTLQGVRVANPEPGQLLIRRKGNSVAKILY